MLPSFDKTISHERAGHAASGGFGNSVVMTRKTEVESENSGRRVGGGFRTGDPEQADGLLNG